LFNIITVVIDRPAPPFIVRTLRDGTPQVHSRVCYKEWCYNEWMLHWTIFINEISVLQWMRRNTIGRCSTHVRMTFQAFLLWLEHQSSSLLSFIRFSYQFGLVTCLFAPLAVKNISIIDLNGKECLCFSCALDCLCF